MAECIECGAKMEPGEGFCGNCCIRQLAVPEDAPASIAIGGKIEVSPVSDEAKTSADIESHLAPAEPSEDPSAGDVQIKTGSTKAHKGTTGGRQPAVKQLDPGSVLNGRYE